MKNWIEIMVDLKKIDTTFDEFENEVIIAFGDYTINGETRVILSKHGTEKYVAYVCDEKSESAEFLIYTEEEEDSVKVIEVFQSREDKYQKMIGKKWAEVKEELEQEIFVDKDFINKKTGECIVDFECCSFLSSLGKIEEGEVIINDEAKIYSNVGDNFLTKVNEILE